MSALLVVGSEDISLPFSLVINKPVVARLLMTKDNILHNHKT